MRFGYSITRGYMCESGIYRQETIAWRHYETSLQRDHFLDEELRSVRTRYPFSKIEHVSWEFADHR